MPRFTNHIKSFSSGELSPRLSSRTDLEQIYNSGSKKITNAIPTYHGPLSYRMGTKFLSECKYSDKPCRIIGFQYSEDVAYIIEAGHEYFRYYTDGGQIWETVSGVATQVHETATTYSGVDLFDINLVQSADTIYLAHNNYPPKKLVRYGNADWQLDEIVFEPPPFLNAPEEDITMTASAATGGIMLTSSDEYFTTAHEGGHIKFKGILERSATITAENTWTDHLVLDNGESLIVSISNTWTPGEVTLQRSFDKGDTWLDYATFDSNTSAEITEGRDNVYYRIGVDTGDYTSGDIDVSISKLAQYGYCSIDTVISGTSASGTVLRELPILSTDDDWYESAWNPLRGYPKAVCFYEGRLLYGGSVHRPMTVWGSQVDDFENFENINNFDEEAYEFSIRSREVNNIQHMIDKEILHICTIGSDIRFGYKDEATTPTNVYAVPNSSKGANHIQSLDADGNIIYVQRGGKKLITLVWNYETERFQPIEFSDIAEHILKDGVVDWCFVQRPDPIIWMVTGAGKLVGCSYDPKKNVRAFHEHVTDGYFESVAYIPDPENDEDQVYFVVRREINGVTKRYIEYFDTYEWTDVADGYWVDSGLKYEGTAISTLTGLDHLEGKEVSILTEGSVHPRCTVSGGAIDLDYDTTKVIVGLPYEMEVETMNLEFTIAGSSTIGKPKNVYDVTLDLQDSLNCSVGCSSDTTDDIPFRNFGDPMDTATDPYTGPKSILFNTGYEKEVSIIIKHSDPLPITLKGIAYTIKTNNK